MHSKRQTEIDTRVRIIFESKQKRTIGERKRREWRHPEGGREKLRSVEKWVKERKLLGWSDTQYACTHLRTATCYERKSVKWANLIWDMSQQDTLVEPSWVALVQCFWLTPTGACQQLRYNQIPRSWSSIYIYITPTPDDWWHTGTIVVSPSSPRPLRSDGCS